MRRVPPSREAFAAVTSRADLRDGATTFQPSARNRANILQTSTVNERNFKTCLRHQFIFQAARRAHELHLRFGLAPQNFFRDGNARINVSARSPGGDQHAHPGQPKREEAIRLAGATRNFRDSFSGFADDSRKSPMLNEPVACCEIFSNTPTAASVGTSDDPP